MSKVTEPILLDKTGQEILKEMKTMNTLMGVQVGVNVGEMGDLNEIRNIVRSGKAEKVFNIGDQIVVPWKDTTTGQSYECPFDIVHFGEVEHKGGEKVPGMFLQMHYATLYGVMFDAHEAAYVVEESPMEPGTYNVEIVTTWSKATEGTYQFTLTKQVPVGGQVCLPKLIADTDVSAWTVSTYTDGSSTTPIETVKMTSGAGGTNLGQLVPAGKNKLNSIHRIGYGSNRWSQSAIRQWLNSKAGVGQWWKSTNKFDRVPDQLATKPGFMTGFGDDFLSILTPIKVTTALNTVSDGGTSDAGTEDTYDTFFLPSLEQMYAKPQLAGKEGEAWTYWKRALGLSSPAEYHPTTYEEYKTFAIENHQSAQIVRLRSANRGTAHVTWYVNAGGYVSNNIAYSADRAAVACAIS